MGECGNDFDCYRRYERRLHLIDKVVLGVIVTCLVASFSFLCIGLFYPQYLLCS
jgi:hypothetical protein